MVTDLAASAAARVVLPALSQPSMISVSAGSLACLLEAVDPRARRRRVKRARTLGNREDGRCGAVVSGATRDERERRRIQALEELNEIEKEESY